MALRRLAAIVPVVGALALAAPVAIASAQAPVGSPGPAVVIPCYPYPAYCGPSGNPWLPLYPFGFATPLGTNPGGPSAGPGPVAFGFGPVQVP